MPLTAGRLYLLVTAYSFAILYGATYQQFRFFSLENPGGAADALHYVGMARAEPVDPEVRHRWMVPAAARTIDRVTSRFAENRDQSMLLSFYLVNFAISLTSCVLLFALLRSMGYSMLLSLLGVAAFASSRMTVLVTATPLVDAAYFCAIALIVWLTLEQRAIGLALALPVMALTKETVLPFLLLPLLGRLRGSPIVWAGIAAAAISFVVSGRVIDGDPSAGVSYVDALGEHWSEIGATLLNLFSVRGLHDLQNGFSLLLPMSVLGAWLNYRHRYHDVPVFVVATLPMAFGLALLSGNLGRMFFAAFPAVIAYALIVVEHVVRLATVDAGQSRRQLRARRPRA